MKKILHKKKLNMGGGVLFHMDPPPIPLIKNKNDDKSDKYF